MKMKKIKTISSSSHDEVQLDIDVWLNSEEAQGINIISVNGTTDSDEDTITYILYEKKPSGMMLS